MDYKWVIIELEIKICGAGAGAKQHELSRS